MHVWKRTAAYLNATFHFFSWDYKRKLMTSQVRALYTWCVTSYNDKSIDLCFIIYVLSALSSAVVTQRVNTLPGHGTHC